jgi:hypothetical protein
MPDRPPAQLVRLAKPFPRSWIKTAPKGGGAYVTHSGITQALLAIVGPSDFRVAEVIRGWVPGEPATPGAESARKRDGRPELANAIVGVVGELTCTIDGRTVTVQEAGDCGDPHNWAHDGARLKDATSDALKRCAMRLGLGLHLWCGNKVPYVLHGQLERRRAQQPDGTVTPADLDPAAFGLSACPTCGQVLPEDGVCPDCGDPDDAGLLDEVQRES